MNALYAKCITVNNRVKNVFASENCYILLTNSGTIAQLDIPSDDLESELSYFDYNTTKRTTTKNSSDKNSFVIRTKTNELADFSNINSINWKENKTENI